MIYNLSKKTLLAKHAVYACGMLDRGRGMIGRRFTDFDAMVFENCNAIHTFFMGASIDVIFIDGENKVLKALRELKPWRLLVNCRDARAVIEMPPGALAKSQTEPGDFIDLRAEPTAEVLKELEKRHGKFIEAAEAGVIAPFEENK